MFSTKSSPSQGLARRVPRNPPGRPIWTASSSSHFDESGPRKISHRRNDASPCGLLQAVRAKTQSASADWSKVAGKPRHAACERHSGGTERPSRKNSWRTRALLESSGVASVKTCAREIGALLEVAMVLGLIQVIAAISARRRMIRAAANAKGNLLDDSRTTVVPHPTPNVPAARCALLTGIIG
jgi:hypothetical protein